MCLSCDCARVDLFEVVPQWMYNIINYWHTMPIKRSCCFLRFIWGVFEHWILVYLLNDVNGSLVKYSSYAISLHYTAPTNELRSIFYFWCSLEQQQSLLLRSYAWTRLRQSLPNRHCRHRQLSVGWCEHLLSKCVARPLPWDWVINHRLRFVHVWFTLPDELMTLKWLKLCYGSRSNIL